LLEFFSCTLYVYITQINIETCLSTEYLNWGQGLHVQVSMLTHRSASLAQSKQVNNRMVLQVTTHTNAIIIQLQSVQDCC